MDDRDDESRRSFPGRLLAALPASALIRALPLPGTTEHVNAQVAERFCELLPERGYKIDVTATRITVRAVPPSRSAGSVMSLGLFELRLPLPIALRLRIFFKNEADALQQFVSNTQSKPWPAADVKPHARVDDDAVHVWYGTSDEASAVVQWRPFKRSELGL